MTRCGCSRCGGESNRVFGVRRVMAARANYGIDAPGDVGKFAAAGLALTGVGVLLSRWRAWRKATLATLALGGWLLSIAGLLVLSSRVGKLHERERLLDKIELRGDERVLDVGCGRGLLLIGAARRLTSGHTVGVDIWSTIDQSGNSPDALLANASAEGVSDRVSSTSGDIRWLPFTDGSFDVVLSSLVLHNLGDQAARSRAVREIARVLKAGGRLAIADLAHTHHYAATLRDAGWSDVQQSTPHFFIFPPVRVVTGTKPK